MANQLHKCSFEYQKKKKICISYHKIRILNMIINKNYVGENEIQVQMLSLLKPLIFFTFI